MKKFYPGPAMRRMATRMKFFLCGLIFSAMVYIPVHAQGLVFKNAQLESGSAGEDNAVYRFGSVTAGVDALVTITGRSSADVRLAAIDLSNSGHDRSFQPQVKCTGNAITANGESNWWMEFSIAFVREGTSALIPVSSFDMTALDIDGNADKLNEWVDVYGLKTYTFEANTLLQFQNIWEMQGGSNVLTGKKFIGPVTNFVNIDTSATEVMVTSHFENTSSIRIRAGGHATGQTGAGDRMYSFWFRNFTYQNPVHSTLPVALESFTLQWMGSFPGLSWVAATEQNLSHYVIQRSENGRDYNDAGILFTGEQPRQQVSYKFTDKQAPGAAMLYYRLKMVDLDGRFEYSPIKLLRRSASANPVLQAYPNPARSELRVSIPDGWQQQAVVYEIYNTGGVLMKRWNKNPASQTEVLDIASLPEGVYVLKAGTGSEQSIQRFIKRN